MSKIHQRWYACMQYVYDFNPGARFPKCFLCSVCAMCLHVLCVYVWCVYVPTVLSKLLVLGDDLHLKSIITDFAYQDNSLY